MEETTYNHTKYRVRRYKVRAGVVISNKSGQAATSEKVIFKQGSEYI